MEESSLPVRENATAHSLVMSHYYEFLSLKQYLENEDMY